jgi:hypothetical protein
MAPFSIGAINRRCVNLGSGGDEKGSGRSIAVAPWSDNRSDVVGDLSRRTMRSGAWEIGNMLDEGGGTSWRLAT